MEHLADFVEHGEAFASDNVKDGWGDGARSLRVELPLVKGWPLDFEHGPDVPLRLFETAGNRTRKSTLPVRCDRVSHEYVERTRTITRTVPHQRRLI